jgi:antitoxin ParD1/3/4
MNVSLTPQLESFVKQKVLSGKYNSTSEVMREALRLLQEQDELKSLKLQTLQKDLLKGANELDQGMFSSLDIEQVKSKARTRKAI